MKSVAPSTRTSNLRDKVTDALRLLVPFTAEMRMFTLSAFRRFMPPPKKMVMWQWAEKHIVIPRRSGTPHPGRYSTSITPWVRGWFDALQDPTINTVAFETAAQVGKTTTAMIALCNWACEDPDPMLYVMPNADDAETLSASRLLPMMEASPMVMETVGAGRYDITAAEYRLKTTTIRFIGANSSAKLASYPHRYILVDEPDKFKERVGREGSVLSLVFARARQFWNRKRALFCTPTTDQGFIHRYYLLGDQRRYFVPCPFCGHMQTLEWPQVKWQGDLSPVEAGKTAYYECVACQAHITDKHKWDMVAKGEWRTTADPQLEGHVSFNLSSLYSNSDECTFQHLVAKFLTAKDNQAELREFINQDLAQIWKDEAHVPLERGAIWEIRDRRRFKRGTIPTSLPHVLVLVQDVQKAHIVWTVWALRFHDAWLVDHGKAVTLDEMTGILSREYVTEDGKKSVCRLQTIDTGHRTMEVYDYCLNSIVQTIPIKGDTGAATTATQPVRSQKIESYPNGKPMPRGRTLTLRHLHPRFFRDQLMDALARIKAEEGQTMQQAIEQLPLRIWFHEEIDSEFVDQMTGEVLVEDPPDKTGKIRQYYKKIRTNDYFDCAHYALATRYMMRGDLAELDAPAKPQDNPEVEERKPEAWIPSMDNWI